MIGLRRKSRPYKPDWVDKTLTAAALVVEAQAVELVPVDTGRLKGSISHVTHIKRSGSNSDQIRGSAASGEAFVGSNVEYAPYVEYGTRRGLRPRPYIRTALDATRKDVKRLIAKYWKREAFGR